MGNTEETLTLLQEAANTQHAEKHFYIILKEQQKNWKNKQRGLKISFDM